MHPNGDGDLASTNRVAAHLEKWFDKKTDLKETLEGIVNSLWEQSVIAPLLRLVEEGAAEAMPAAPNVVRFPSQVSA